MRCGALGWCAQCFSLRLFSSENHFFVQQHASINMHHASSYLQQQQHLPLDAEVIFVVDA